MAVNIKVIIPAKQAEAVQTTQYTATNCYTIIDKFTVTNTTSNNINFSVNIVADGGSATAANRIISVRAIAAGETYSCPELIGHAVSVDGFISTLASAATSLTIRATGREIT